MNCSNIYMICHNYPPGKVRNRLRENTKRGLEKPRVRCEKLYLNTYEA